jgi:DNA-binding CsgD family transcriptional regulator
MESNRLKQASETMLALLSSQNFDEAELDYSNFERQRPLLQTLATMGNSGVSIFDAFQKKHIFYSPNFGASLGYDCLQIQHKGHDYWDAKIHPNDFDDLMQNGITLLKLLLQFSTDEKANYKLINEYRILNSSQIYTRIIEQHQVLELDKKGNIWLNLSIIDISPDQNTSEGLKSQLFNFRTGNIISFNKEKSSLAKIDISLSKRELQILKMVKDGLLSKEISSNLNISLHTVNTHRQRVLEKLGANNSMEAVVFASKHGLL